jgi:RNA polymerase sigma factor (sigma-70 family)
MVSNELIPHLFRTEYSKIVTVLTKLFGLEHVEIAEDITSETFMLAVETWPYKGIPENPAAWLYTVAKNKTKNHLTRNRIFEEKVVQNLKSNSDYSESIRIDLSNKNIKDSQLQMLFTICHPTISVESQICMALRILCGFGINEIADALLSNSETIHKRLQRAKEKLRTDNIEIEFPNANQLNERLDTVLQTIYLLFSEGYYSESNNLIIRKELCVDAINLTYLLLENPLTNTHPTNSLMSLMCFHASRLEARQSKKETIILYDEQKKDLWDTELIEKGFYYLQQASKWEIASKYYIEASIAYWHTVDNDIVGKWDNILKLYDALLLVDNSSIIALNRMVSLSKVHGNLIAIQETEKLNLSNNHFYYILLAELYMDINIDKSLENLQSALDICKTNAEEELILSKFEKIKSRPHNKGSQRSGG